MKIEFQNPVTYTVIQENKITLTEVNVLKMMDLPKDKMVIVMTREAGDHVLWKDEEYDQIGQWTDQDVANKLTEILNSTK